VDELGVRSWDWRRGTKAARLRTRLRQTRRQKGTEKKQNGEGGRQGGKEVKRQKELTFQTVSLFTIHYSLIWGDRGNSSEFGVMSNKSRFGRLTAGKRRATGHELFHRCHSVLDGKFYQRRMVPDAQFLHQPAAVGFYGFRRYKQYPTDLGAGFPLCRELQNFPLPLA